jgi:hypothetical protein
MKAETVEEFLLRGGRIRKIKESDDRFAVHTSHFHHQEKVNPSLNTIDAAFRCRRTVKKYRRGTGGLLNTQRNLQGKHVRGAKP